MRIVVFSDVHANILALSKILEEIEKENYDRVYCLGDLVGYGPRPSEVIETLRKSKINTVMGNYDEGIGFEKGDCGCAYVTYEEKSNGLKSIEWTTNQVTQQEKEYLRSLLDKIKVTVNGCKIYLVHGSPRRINEYLYEDHPEKSLKRILDSIDADILVCGHTHKPYHRIVNGKHVINVGSVGKPKDGDSRACYAVLDLNNGVNVEFKRIEYAIDPVVEEIINVGLPRAFADDLLKAGN